MHKAFCWEITLEFVHTGEIYCFKWKRRDSEKCQLWLKLCYETQEEVVCSCCRCSASRHDLEKGPDILCKSNIDTTPRKETRGESKMWLETLHRIVFLLVTLVISHFWISLLFWAPWLMLLVLHFPSIFHFPLFCFTTFLRTLFFTCALFPHRFGLYSGQVFGLGLRVAVCFGCLFLFWFSSFYKLSLSRTCLPFLENWSNNIRLIQWQY